MAQNDIIVAKEGAGGSLAEIALTPADIGAATSESTVQAAKALADEYTGNPALIYTSEGGNGWYTLTDPAGFRSALELSTSGNAAGLYDNTAGQVGAVVNDFSFRINGDGVSADFDTANLTASRAYGLPNASGTLGLSEPADNVFRVVGSADATKKVAFEVDGLSSVTTRTLTVPDASGTIALTSDFASPPAIGSTTPNTGAFTTLSATPTSGSALTLTGGTVTASAPLISATQTWNNAAVAFTGLRVAITNTNSATASRLFDFTVGGSSVLSARSVLGNPPTEVLNIAGPSRGFVFGSGGAATGDASFSLRWQQNIAGFWRDIILAWGTDVYGLNYDLAIQRDAADTLAQRRGASAQDFRIYGQFTTTTNFERLSLKYNSTATAFQIGTEKGTSGSARPLEFQTDGTTRMVISATGDVGIASTSAPTGGFGSAVIGQLNTASGNASYVLGRDSTASSTWAVALAYRSLADRNAMLAFAGGRFAARGDAQNARFVLRCTTTTNAAVEMFLGDTTTTYLTIPSGKVIFCNIKVVGVKSDGSVVATYERQYAAKNVAGTSSEVFAPVTIGTDNASSTSLEIATVDAGDYIRIRPTGIASETWRWVATVDAVEVAYGA